MIELRRLAYIGQMERMGPYGTARMALRVAVSGPRTSGRAHVMALRRRKSKTSQVVDLLETYLKLQAAKKATKGARKAAKGTAVYQVAKRTPVIKRIPIIAGAGVAIAVVVTKLRSSGGDSSAPAGA